jgi:subtilase family serine protease
LRNAQEFTEQFGPAAEDYAKVTAFAQSYGLAVTRTTPNRLVLDVSGTVAPIERAFQVTMQVYQHPTEAHLLRAQCRTLGSAGDSCAGRRWAQQH